MMTYRKVLVVITAAFALVGIALAMKPFIDSLNPTPRAVANLPHIDISDLKAGSYRYESTGREWGYRDDWLIIRDADNDVYVFTVPKREDKYLMPDLTWFRYGGLCSEFGPGLINGRVEKTSVIECHDSGLNEWGRGEWRWALDGRNLGDYTQDMFSPKYHVSNNQVIVGKKISPK